MNSFNPAVITPYYKEDLSVIERCHKSIREQTVPCTHFLISDGRASEYVENWSAQHIILPYSHADYGNTPRAIGALSAINQGFNPILFLDADNWFSPEHAEIAIAIKLAFPDADVTASYRQLVLPDGTEIDSDAEDSSQSHIDTSCLTMFENSFFLLPLWATMTKPLSVIGDRIMYEALKTNGLKVRWTGFRSLYYTTNCAHHWRRAGKPAPPNCPQLDTSIMGGFSPEKLYSWSRLTPEAVVPDQFKHLLQITQNRSI